MNDSWFLSYSIVVLHQVTMYYGLLLSIFWLVFALTYTLTFHFIKRQILLFLFSFGCLMMMIDSLSSKFYTKIIESSCKKQAPIVRVEANYEQKRHQDRHSDRWSRR